MNYADQFYFTEKATFSMIPSIALSIEGCISCYYPKQSKCNGKWEVKSDVNGATIYLVSSFLEESSDHKIHSL